MTVGVLVAVVLVAISVTLAAIGFGLTWLSQSWEAVQDNRIDLMRGPPLSYPPVWSYVRRILVKPAKLEYLRDKQGRFRKVRRG